MVRKTTKKTTTTKKSIATKPLPKFPESACSMRDMCPLFNKREAQLDEASQLAFLIRWLEKHTEYLRDYNMSDSRYRTRVWTGFHKNYPLIDCAKAEYNDFVAKMRHGKVKEPPYQNPFKKMVNEL